MPLTDPVPSSSFDVLERNVQDTDKFVNQETGTFTNRVGKVIKPIPVIEAEANAAIISLGWTPVGEFATGFTYTKLNDVGRDSLGSWWRYNGSDLPKVITAGTVPSSPNFSVISFETADNVQWESGKSVGYALDDLQGFTAELLAQAGIVDDGQPDELGASQRVEAMRKIFASFSGDTVHIRVPTDYPDVIDAINSTRNVKTGNGTLIEILIEAGFEIAKGIDIRNYDASRYVIRSVDPVVKLSAAFSPCDISDLSADYAGIVGEGTNPLMFGFYSKMPVLACVIDMQNMYGSGIQLAESECTVAHGCGVVNAGFRGIQVHGRANLYGANFSGATGAALRVQQGSTVCANSFNGDNSMKGADGSNAAIYVSRSSSCEFRYGSAQNSGADGLTCRRSKVTAADANFSGSAGRGIFSESVGDVDFIGGTATNCVGVSVLSTYGSRIHVGQATLSRANPANPAIQYQQGGMVFTNDGTVLNGVSGSATTLRPFVAGTQASSWDGNGLWFHTGTGAFGAVAAYSNADGFYEMFADGTMISTLVKNIATGTVTSGSFSGQITLPTLPNDTDGVPFVSVQSVHYTVVGRTAVAGGNRVFISFCGRGLASGSENKFRNDGVQLDGAGVNLNVLSIDLTITVRGRWRV